MAENDQLSEATKPGTAGSSSTQVGSEAVNMDHADAIVPHQISNHDKLVQEMVMVDGEWVNVNDTNDQKNMQEDLHKVNRVVTEAQKDIIDAKNTADSAVKSADSAISASKVNSDAIKAVNSATKEAKAGADKAISQANALMSNVGALGSNTAAGLKSAVAAVNDVKAQVAVNSAAILKNGKAIEIQEQTASSAIVDLKVANGAIQTVAKNASNQATIAMQTASGASLTAMNANSQALSAIAQAGSVKVRLSGVEKKLDSASTAVTSNAVQIGATQKLLLAKADKVVVDKTNQTVDQLSAQVKETADQLSSKITQAQLTNYVEGKGFATETFTQNLVDQTSKTWGVNLSKLTKTVNDNQSASMQKMTNLQASIDGLQGTVIDYKKSTTSQINAFANGFSSKVWQVLQDNSARKAAIIEDSDQVDLDDVIKPGKYLLTGELIHSPFSEVTDPVSSASNSSASADPASSLSGSAAASGQGTTTSAAVSAVNSASNAASDASTSSSSDSGSAAESAEKPVPHSVPTNVILIVSSDKNGLSQIVYQSNSDVFYKRSATVADSKATWDKWFDPQKDDESAITQMQNDINFKIKGNGLMSQINLEAGRLLFDSDKIYLDAKSVVFGKDSKAFIPAALITDLSADYIKTGVLDASIVKVKNFNANSINAGTLSGINIQSTDSDGNKYQMIGPNLYWLGADSQARIGQAHQDNNELEMFVTDDSLEKIIGDDKPYSIIGAPDVLISTAGVWDSQGKDTVNSPNYYPKIMLKGWTSTDWLKDQNAKPGAYITAGGSTLKLMGDFIGATNGGNSYGTDLDKQVGSTLYVNGWHGFQFNINHLHDGTSDADWQKGAQFNFQKDNRIGAYFGKGDHGNRIEFVTAGDGGAVYVDSSLMVHGSKNAIVPTTQGTVAINAYETAGYYFGDIGEDKTNESKKAWVGIDYLFGQTVNTSVPYQVFVTPYSNARVWVSK